MTDGSDGAIGQRISEEIDRRGWAARDLSAALPPGTRGASYRSIYRYMDGDRPSDAFLLAAANALGVRYEWLRYGEPPRAAQDAARGEPAVQGLRSIVSAVLARRADAERLQLADVVPPATNVAMAILRLARTNQEMDDNARYVAEQVADLVFGPIAALEPLRATRDRSTAYLHNVSAYASAVAGALLVLVPEPRSPNVPLEEIVADWRQAVKQEREGG